MRLAVATVILLLFITPPSQSNSWRGLIPLRSTCDDVKKSLNIDKCSMPLTHYTRPEMQVMIAFATQDCDSEPKGWRVPKGTVTAIILSPQIPMVPSELGLDISKYEKREDGEIVGIDHYTSEKEGVIVDMYAGVIQNVFLYPRKADDALKCKPTK